MVSSVNFHFKSQFILDSVIYRTFL